MVIKAFLALAVLAIGTLGACSDDKAGDPETPAIESVSAEPVGPSKDAANAPAKPEAPDEPAIAPEPRQPDLREPDGDRNPTVVTKRLMRGIAEGKWLLDRFVDPDRGVIFLELLEDSESRSVKHSCGKQLQRELKRVEKFLLQVVPNAEADEFWCKNKPAPKCAAGILGEHSPAKELWFRLDPKRGLFLDTVFTRDTAYRDAKAERKFTGRQVKRLADKRCRPDSK